MVFNCLDIMFGLIQIFIKEDVLELEAVSGKLFSVSVGDSLSICLGFFSN